MKSPVILDNFLRAAERVSGQRRSSCNIKNFTRAALLIVGSSTLTACGGIVIGGPTIRAPDIIEDPSAKGKGVGLICTSILEHDDDTQREVFLYASINTTEPNTTYYAATTTGKLGIESGVRVDVVGHSPNDVIEFEDSFSQHSLLEFSPHEDRGGTSRTYYSTVPLPSRYDVMRATRYVAELAIIRATHENYGPYLCPMHKLEDLGFR